MRISDWSSDVCSSDLTSALTELESVKSRLQDAEAHGEQYRKIAHAAEQTVKQLMQKNKERESQQKSELEQARQEQIGRAQYRERGCQYGEIAVGDEALKKKRIVQRH